MEKECSVCKKSFEARVPQQKYCCYGCQLEAQKGKYQRSPNEICAGTVGAISELRVITDLLAKGYEVFKAVSPHCSCDLAVLKDSTLLRVEVTTGHYTNGDLKPSSNKLYRSSQYDILAIVSPKGDVIQYSNKF